MTPDGRRTAAGSSIAVTAVVVLLALASSCAPDTTDTGAGATLYQRNCASCHGADLRGTALGPLQLSIVYEPSHHSDESYRRAIRQGVAAHHWGFGPMPAISGLDDAEIDAIIGHVREVQAREGFEPYPPD